MQTIKAIAEAAMGWLGMQRLVPSPQNYWLAFAMLSGAHAELARTIGGLTDRGLRLRQAEADALYEQFLGRTAMAAPMSPRDPRQDALRHQTLRLADLAASAKAATRQFSRDLASQMPAMSGYETADLQRLAAATLDRAQRSERELASTTAEVEQLRQKLETVQGDAQRDALTNLPNRRGVDAHLAAACAEGGAVLAMCDIDRFKTYNDRYGHGVGDRVLKTVAASLRDSLAGHFVGRWGGEEFVAVLKGDVARGVTLLDRARADLGRRRFKLRDTDEPMGSITFSAGVVALPSQAAKLGEALTRADALLYAAKARGRDMVLGGELPAAIAA